MSLENEDNSSRVLKHVNPHVKKNTYAIQKHVNI